MYKRRYPESPDQGVQRNVSLGILDSIRTQNIGRLIGIEYQKQAQVPPKSIPDLYNQILGDIKVDNAEAAKNILRWVVLEERPHE
jgi:hypothetical protein